MFLLQMMHVHIPSNILSTIFELSISLTYLTVGLLVIFCVGHFLNKFHIQSWVPFRVCFCVDANLLCFNGRLATMTNPSSGHKRKLFWKLSQIATTTSYPVVEVGSIDWYGLVSRHLCDRCSGWGCMQNRRHKFFNKGDLRLCSGAWPKNW